MIPVGQQPLTAVAAPRFALNYMATIPTFCVYLSLVKRIPDTVHLDFCIPADTDLLRKLRDRLGRLGATPKETFKIEPEASCIVTIPISLKEELASYGLLGLRLLDDLDVEPCSAQLN